MTHSLKVGQVARRIAEYLIKQTKDMEILERVGGLDADVSETAVLAHDLEHPPFGHVGEYKLQELTGEAHFEGNAQSFRILVALEPHGGNYQGLNLTQATLCGVLKYPWPRHQGGGVEKKKYGTYQSELDAFKLARSILPDGDNECSLEAEIMGLADDITFAIHDTEDFFRAGMIPLESLCPVGAKDTSPEFNRLIQYIERRRGQGVDEEERKALTETLPRLNVHGPYRGTRVDRVLVRQGASGLIGQFVREGIKVNKDWAPGGRRIIVDECIERRLKMLKELVWCYVIDHPSLASQQAGHEAVIERLYEYFHQALAQGQDKRFPPQFTEIVKERNKSEVLDARLAADMVCSLTDEGTGTFSACFGFGPGRDHSPSILTS